MVKRAKLRKITAGLLAFMLVTSALPVVDILPIDSGVSFGITASAADGNVVASGYCGKNGGQNVKWELTENGTLPDGATAYKLTITGLGEMAGYDFFNQSPWNSNGQHITSVDIAYGVTSIGAGAFFDCSALTSVTIPKSVTSIGASSFYDCSALKSVTIPNSVTSIGGSAFYCCSSLSSVTIPDSVTSIGGAAFAVCKKLESVTIPNSVTSIGGAAFYECSSLTSVTIPDSVTSIGDNTFYKCSKLKSVTIGKNVTSIGRSAFLSCSELKSVNIGENVTSIGESAFYKCSALESVTIPDGVESIGAKSFYKCSALKSVTIGKNVTSIGESSFSDCSALKSVTIPCSVKSFGSYVFDYCPDTLKYHLVEGSYADKNISTNKVYDQYHSFIGADGKANTTDEKCLCGEVYNINFSGLDSKVQVRNPVYDGTAQTPTITIDGLIASTDGGATGDYIIETITPKTNAGEYTATITGINNYAGTREVEWSIAPAVAEPTASAITYGQELSEATLSDSNWSWVDGTVIPTVENTGYAAKITVDDTNYDYTGVEGYDSNTHMVTRTISVTVNKAEISTVTITGVDSPAEGQILDTTAETTDTAYTLGAASWSDGDTTAGFDKQYTVTIIATISDSNYKFADTITAAVNGETATASVNADGTVTVTYTFAKTAEARVTGIEITAEPTKKTYSVGDTLDLTGGKIKVTYEDGKTDTVDITSDMVSGFDSTVEGDKTVIVTYGGFTDTFMVTVAHTHTPATEWSSDSIGHWHTCAGCTEKVDFAAHISDNGTVTTPATETEEGVRTYKCTVCDYVIRTEPIPTIHEEHTHNYAAEWSSDNTSHWHQCSCGDKTDIGSHISNGGIVIVQPTYNSTGLRTYSCTVCGYVMRTETIPALKQDYYPNYIYDDFNPFINVTPAYSFEQIKLTGKISKNNVILKWTEVGDADKYTVYQLIDGKYKAIKTTTENTYTVKNLPTGKYKFIVRYTVDGRISPISKCNSLTANIKNSKPYPAATVKNNIVTLKWQPVDNAEKYAIYLVKDGKATKLKEIKKTSVRYKLKPGKEYQFVVRAYVDGKWTTMKTSDIVKVTAEE